MENLTISINTGIKDIAINNEKGEHVYTLHINTADAKTAERYLNVMNNLNHVSDGLDEQIKAVEAMEEGTEKKLAQAHIHVSTIEKCIEEIDSIFGEGCIRNVYHDCYALNDSFLPDEEMLLNFLENVMPIMNQLFNERFENHRKKYSAKRRGKA